MLNRNNQLAETPTCIPNMSGNRKFICVIHVSRKVMCVIIGKKEVIITLDRMNHLQAH